MNVDNARYSRLMERIKASTDPDMVTMTPDDAAVYIPMEKGQLAQLRYTGHGPLFMKPSPRVVIYRKKDIDAWLASSVRQSTAPTETL